MSNVIVVIGAGSIGQAIARRVSAGKHVLLADLRQESDFLMDGGVTAAYWFGELAREFLAFSTPPREPFTDLSPAPGDTPRSFLRGVFSTPARLSFTGGPIRGHRKQLIPVGKECHPWVG